MQKTTPLVCQERGRALGTPVAATEVTSGDYGGRGTGLRSQRALGSNPDVTNYNKLCDLS